MEVSFEIPTNVLPWILGVGGVVMYLLVGVVGNGVAARYSSFWREGMNHVGPVLVLLWPLTIAACVFVCCVMPLVWLANVIMGSEER